MVRESSELTLRWSDTDTAFSFDAGALCLEFVTTGGHPQYAWYETLRTPAEFAAWLAVCRLRVEDARVTEDDLAAALRLRGALYATTADLLAGRPLAPPAVAVINELAEPAPPVPKLAGGRHEWVLPVHGRQAVSAIARDAVDLFGGPYAARVRECSSADCSLLFVDLSRPGKRRWCSMDRCGNRAKQRGRTRVSARVTAR